ncbi:MAG: outer membrane beta-barrel protein [Planctomycetaceae bacterium]
MIRRSWKSFLTGMALVGGMTAANAAFASDGCCTPAGVDCKQCEQIFADAGTKLTEQLAGMSCCDAGSCCAPASVCDPGSTNTCGDALAESCGEVASEAPERTLGMFGDWGHGVTTGGWTQFGYQSGPDGAFTGNGAFNNTNFGGGFNNATEENNFNLRQQGLYIGKLADGSKGVDWGFRVETIYGVDAGEGQSFGNNPGEFDFLNGWDHGIYEWAMPQLYAEMAIDDLTLKVGHFYTPVGYETVPTYANFFFSGGLTWYNSEPFTHTGILGTYKASDNLTVLGGWTAGWDTGFDRFNNGSNVLAGTIYKLTDATTFTYVGTFGNLGSRGDGTLSSMYITQNWSDKISTVHQLDVLNTNLGTNFETDGLADNSIGQINYLFYTINDKLKAGTRQEWYKADGTSYNTLTWGVNIKPMDKLVIRPEVRHMWAPGATNSLAAPGHDDLFNSTVFGIDAIITY